MRCLSASFIGALLATTTPCLADGPNQPWWSDIYFNTDIVAPGSIMLMDNSMRLGAWRTVGQRGNVAFVSGSYAHHGFSFPSQYPGQETKANWLNLAGISQSKTGVAHRPVPTTVGAAYSLSFYVGNVYDPNGVYGTTSTVAVYANKMFLGNFTNSDGQGSTTQNWKQFSLTFTADAPYTAIAFINGDPPGDLDCGLDSVILAPVSGPTP